MTKFLIGGIVGFLTCVWAVGMTPNDAFLALWSKLQKVQEASAAASQAYEAANAQPPQCTQSQRPLLTTGSLTDSSLTMTACQP